MGKFEELRVWQESKDLSITIYKLTNSGAFSKDFGLKDQIRRASVSVPSNIAEGDELGTVKQSIRHFHIAKGSAAEVYTQLIIASEIGYIDESIAKDLCSKYQDIGKKLNSLIKARGRFMK